MTTENRVALYGAPASPYTRKMLALLRYRRIPYRLLTGTMMEDQNLPRPKVQLLPTFFLPNENGEIEAVTDSTPLLRRLEVDYPGRSVIPTNPVISFLNSLLEDFADEWLTKAMFHYRWNFAGDIQKASLVLPRSNGVTSDEDTLQNMTNMFRERQTSRLHVVGSNAITAPVIEGSYINFLKAFDAHLANGYRFLLGARPSSADFATSGQLTALVLFDPTSNAAALEHSPRTYAWVEVGEDLSGFEPGEDDWITPDAIPETLRAILAEVGRYYAPVMLANAKALEDGAELAETEVDGCKWTQKPFSYQGKCLKWIREDHAALGENDRKRVDDILEGTGCEALFA